MPFVHAVAIKESIASKRGHIYQPDTWLLFPAFYSERCSCRWFNLFTFTCSQYCVCCSLFFNCSSLAVHCVLRLVCSSQRLPPSAFFFWFQIFISFWFSFLKLHKGSRTHAQLPRRPVPPAKPRRTKKGVSRCRPRLPSPPPLFSSLVCFSFCLFHCSFLLFQLLLLTQRPGGIF